jgi:hypothetical protein
MAIAWLQVLFFSNLQNNEKTDINEHFICEPIFFCGLRQLPRPQLLAQGFSDGTFPQPLLF